MSADFSKDPLKAIYERLRKSEKDLIELEGNARATARDAGAALAGVRALEDLIRPTIIEGGT